MYLHLFSLYFYMDENLEHYFLQSSLASSNPTSLPSRRHASCDGSYSRSIESRGAIYAPCIIDSINI